MNIERYRQAEATLHQAAGLEAEEVWVDLARTGTRARVLVTGEGVPMLFLTGGPDGGGSSWAYAAARLTGVRALLLDRPGTGLSAPPEPVPDDTSLASYMADLPVDVLDAFDLEQAILVGCSFGGAAALRTAATYPDRVPGIYLAGCPPFVDGWTPPGFFSALRIPVLGRLLTRLPATRSGARMSLRMLGHHRALVEERLPEPLLDWVFAWQRHTDSMRNDAAMIRASGTWLGGFATGLDLDSETLRAVKAPCHVLVGTDDVVGQEDVARSLAAAVPTAAVEVWEGVGHLPWYDDPERFVSSLQSFVASIGPGLSPH